MSDFLSSLPVNPSSTPSSSAVSSTGALNVALLAKEVKQGLQEEKTYKAVDTMKKKAIHTSQTYEEFKNFVACAEQKPLDRGEMESLKETKGSWTQQKTRHALNLKKSKRSSKKEKRGVVSKKFPVVGPKTGMEFDRDWRRHCDTEERRWRYLNLAGPGALGGIWKTEVDAGIMGKVLETVKWAWDQRDVKGGEGRSVEGEGKGAGGGGGEGTASPVVATVTPSVVSDYLHMLTGCGRFSLNVNFLDDKQVKVVKELIQVLKDEGIEGTEGLEEKWK
ncbi:hypothetical protein TrCOL_g5788 [Triparma columacea]|uniref:Coiled-coil domain-containing protein 103 n=1 Tax=Triparma columacea TaxID=722753 RepID=A0A9W7G4A1_9STRA|nr:hypothetical protein TrCOL_g5788 [Triparma columacea]